MVKLNIAPSKELDLGHGKILVKNEQGYTLFDVSMGFHLIAMDLPYARFEYQKNLYTTISNTLIKLATEKNRDAIAEVLADIHTTVYEGEQADEVR